MIAAMADGGQRTVVYAPPAMRRGELLAATEEAIETWARAQLGYEAVRGYNDSDATCRDSVSAEHWDTATDILARRVDALVVSAVSGAIDSLSMLHQAILWAVYCNRIGHAVWRRGVLAGLGYADLAALHIQALQTIRPMLRARGLVV